MHLCLPFLRSRIAHSPVFQPRDRPRSCSKTLLRSVQASSASFMHNDNFLGAERMCFPRQQGMCVCQRTESSKLQAIHFLCPHLEGSCGARLWKFGGDPITRCKERDCGLSMRVIGCTSQLDGQEDPPRYENLGKLHRGCRKRKGSEISGERRAESGNGS